MPLITRTPAQDVAARIERLADNTFDTIRQAQSQLDLLIWKNTEVGTKQVLAELGPNSALLITFLQTIEAALNGTKDGTVPPSSRPPVTKNPDGTVDLG